MIGIVSGLKRELRCLGLRRPQGTLTFAAAGSPDRAYARAQGWIAAGRITALMSFGLCGGLDPALASGTLIAAHDILLGEGGVLNFDARWARAIAAAVPGTIVAPILGAASAAISVAEKAALFAKHKAAAVDMESRGVAEAAREANLPFVALRAVADPAASTLPRTALQAINAHGRLRPFRVLLGLLARPGDFAALVSLAKAAGRGYDALAGAVKKGAASPDLAPR